MICSEKWTPIPNYENLYEVSNKGRVRSLDRDTIKKYRGVDRRNVRKGVVLKVGYLRGYTHVVLCKEGKTKVFKVHRLVLMGFNPVENYEQLQVNHKNFIRDDNRLENLEWVTPSGNLAYNCLKDKNSSKYPYITYEKSSGKWRVRLPKSKHVGRYNTEEEAKVKLRELYLSNKEDFPNLDFIMFNN